VNQNFGGFAKQRSRRRGLYQITPDPVIRVKVAPDPASAEVRTPLAVGLSPVAI